MKAKTRYHNICCLIGILFSVSCMPLAAQRVNISPIDCGVSAGYNLSTIEVDETAIQFSLDYIPNVYHRALYYYTTSSIEAPARWTEINKMQGVWGFSVNGLVVQTLNIPMRATTDPNTSVCCWPWFSKRSDYNFHWLIDGVDLNNRVGELDHEDDRDHIRFLMSNGSVLVLKNLVKRGELDQDDATLYIGTYYHDSHNSSVFAKVEYDDTYFPQSWRDVLKGASESHLNKHRPRVVRLYLGDGLAYLYREIVLPYGATELTRGSEAVQAALRAAGPTIMYLEEVRKDQKVLLNLTRSKHYPTEDNPDFTLGRALFTGFEGHRVSWDVDLVTVETPAGTTKLRTREQTIYHFSSTSLENLNSYDWETPYNDLQSNYYTSQYNDYFGAHKIYLDTLRYGWFLREMLEYHEFPNKFDFAQSRLLMSIIWPNRDTVGFAYKRVAGRHRMGDGCNVGDYYNYHVPRLSRIADRFGSDTLTYYSTQFELYNPNLQFTQDKGDNTQLTAVDYDYHCSYFRDNRDFILYPPLHAVAKTHVVRKLDGTPVSETYFSIIDGKMGLPGLSPSGYDVVRSLYRVWKDLTIQPTREIEEYKYWNGITLSRYKGHSGRPYENRPLRHTYVARTISLGEGRVSVSDGHDVQVEPSAGNPFLCLPEWRQSYAIHEGSVWHPLSKETFSYDIEELNTGLPEQDRAVLGRMVKGSTSNMFSPNNWIEPYLRLRSLFETDLQYAEFGNCSIKDTSINWYWTKRGRDSIDNNNHYENYFVFNTIPAQVQRPVYLAPSWCLVKTSYVIGQNRSLTDTN